MLFDVSSLSGPDLDSSKNLFAEKKRAAWKSINSREARCDFAPNRCRLNSRGVLFISLWKASVYGMTLSEIKADESMIDFFAKNISDFIARFFNISENSINSISSDFSASSALENRKSWAIITPPPRRHTENNFAVNVARRISLRLGILFFQDVAKALSRQRVNANFQLLDVPEADNIICFDDIVTTGSTFSAMNRILSPYNKNIIYITAINNKL